MEIVVRATIVFLLLLLLLRLLGKRELGQMTPFDIVTLIVLGDLVQQAVTHNDTSLTGAVLAAGTFALLAFLLGWIGFHFRPARRWFEGEPRVLIRDGTVLERNLVRDRIAISDIESEMRLAGIARIDQVAWAILEPSGRISFIEHEGNPRRPPSRDPGIA